MQFDQRQQGQIGTSRGDVARFLTAVATGTAFAFALSTAELGCGGDQRMPDEAFSMQTFAGEGDVCGEVDPIPEVTAKETRVRKKLTTTTRGTVVKVFDEEPGDDKPNPAEVCDDWAKWGIIDAIAKLGAGKTCRDQKELTEEKKKKCKDAEERVEKHLETLGLAKDAEKLCVDKLKPKVDAVTCPDFPRENFTCEKSVLAPVCNATARVDGQWGGVRVRRRSDGKWEVIFECKGIWAVGESPGSQFVACDKVGRGSGGGPGSGFDFSPPSERPEIEPPDDDDAPEPRFPHEDDDSPFSI